MLTGFSFFIFFSVSLWSNGLISRLFPQHYNLLVTRTSHTSRILVHIFAKLHFSGHVIGSSDWQPPRIANCVGKLLTWKTEILIGYVVGWTFPVFTSKSSSRLSNSRTQLAPKWPFIFIMRSGWSSPNKEIPPTLQLCLTGFIEKSLL